MINPPKISKLTTEEKLLMGPGPSNIHPETSLAMSKPILGHLDPDFLRILDENQEMLRYVFQTKNTLTLPISATGSAGMETCILNLVEPGDTVLIAINGVFGARMKDVAERSGAKVETLTADWGSVFSLEEIEEGLKKFSPKVFGIVHAETSTGAQQPMEGLGALVHKYDCLLLLDCVTSLGGTKVLIDEWEVDAVYSGTQKCLSAPPGLSPVSFSQRAEEKMAGRKSKNRSWYFDLSMVKSYFGGERLYHHTAPINMNYSLHASLHEIVEEGLENRWKRHEKNHQILKAGLEALNIEFPVAEKYRLPQLNAVKIPEGVEDVKIRNRMLELHKIEIGSGLGAFKGKYWRIGLMGHTSRAQNVIRCLSALKECFLHFGYPVPEDPIEKAYRHL